MSELMLGHYRNRVIRPAYFSGVDLESLKNHLETETLIEKPYVEGISLCKVVLDTRNLFMDMADDGHAFGRYPVNIGSRPGLTPHGEYIIAEKWEDPYQKRFGKYFLPGQLRHKIGDRLIVLYDPEKGRKLRQSIHAWPHYIFSIFRQGRDSKGCVRLRKRDMHELFDLIDLGSRFIIQ